MNFSSPFGSIFLKSTIVLFIILAFVAPPCARAQGEGATQPPTETEVAQRSLARARALAAIGKLAAAAVELEAMRAGTREESLRDVARVLLISIYVEMPDYARASALLDESFGARTSGRTDDAAMSAYFALAGQAINSIRQHLDRYRSYGLNIADADLPAEAVTDLEQLRGMLEKMVEHARAVGAERAGAQDATALLEDAATVRLRIARDARDRATWQGEVSEARQRLFASETRIASINSVPAARRAQANQSANQPPTAQPSQPSTARPSTQSAPSQSTQSSTAQTANQPAGGSAGTAQQPASTSDGQSAPALVAVGSLATLARQRVSPSYPQVARTARVGGVVTVYLVVNEKGDVESIERVEGPLQLQQAASDAARRWKFNPTEINGRATRVSGYISFNFTL